ncbi:MAG: hypothetical protein ABIN97_04245, partial [Ginsengibacter sp.]
NDLLYVPFSTYIASKNDYIMQLAQFDGKKLELIPNPNKGDGYNGDPIVVNNILYFLYGSSNWEYGSPHNSFPHLAKFDGKLITLISNPDKGHYIRGSQVEYNSNLYLTYINALGISHLARYDGSKLQLLPNPDKGNGFNGTLFVYNGKLFSGYRNAKGIQQLAVYDGHLFKLIFGPGRRGKYGFSDPVIYKNKLFFDWDSNLAYLE